MNKEQLMRAAEYVAVQCAGCADSPKILSYKAFDVMKNAVENGQNPYEALNAFLGTSISEEVLKSL